jgi:hypothetical protein
MSDDRRSSPAWFGAAMACLLAGSAAAADAPSPKREVPDYDGRPPAPTTVRQASLWLPRILLAPLYLTSEYVIRRPLAVVVPAAERVDLPWKVYDLLTFGADHQAGIAPIGFVQFGFKPSFGLYAFWSDALVAGHDLRLHLETRPVAWLSGSFTERLRLSQHTLELRIAASRRPDQIFFGVGPRSLASHRSRYAEDLVDTRLRIDLGVGRLSHVQVAAGLRRARFHPGEYGGDPGVDAQAAAGAFALPDGYRRGYTAPYQRVLVVVDSRQPWPAPGSGARLKLQVEQGTDLHTSPYSGWLRTEVSAGGFYDLTGTQRVLGLSLAAMFADPLGMRPVPFTELVSLGGNGPMRGLPGGRLSDRSAAVLTLRYEWPVGPWLAGTIAAALGNVFSERLRGFEPALLRQSYTLGLASAVSQDYPFEVLVGFGTDTFAQGGRIDSVILSVGVNRGL